MIVTRTYESKFIESELVVLDNDCCTRHNQTCEVIDVIDVGMISPEFKYTVRFADGFVIEYVDEYDLRLPTIDELNKYAKGFVKRLA